MLTSITGIATETNERNVYGESRTDTVQEFVQRYQIRFEDDGSLWEVLSRDLFVATSSESLGISVCVSRWTHPGNSPSGW